MRHSVCSQLRFIINHFSRLKLLSEVLEMENFSVCYNISNPRLFKNDIGMFTVGQEDYTKLMLFCQYKVCKNADCTQNYFLSSNRVLFIYLFFQSEEPATSRWQCWPILWSVGHPYIFYPPVHSTKVWQIRHYVQSFRWVSIVILKIKSKLFPWESM